MLVAVQVVHQVAVAAVLGDDEDGPCGGTGSGTVPGAGGGRSSYQGHEANDGLHVGQQRGLGARQTWTFLTVSKALSFPELYFPHLLNGASNTHPKGLH